MRNLFQNPEFTQRNVIASQVEKVISALAKGNFSRADFLKNLDPYYKAIEREGSNLSHFTEKQDFLNSVYEQFFQKFSPDIADTHGIVYTPREIVDYMCNSVEQALKEEFGYTLASPEVVAISRSLHRHPELHREPERTRARQYARGCLPEPFLRERGHVAPLLCREAERRACVLREHSASILRASPRTRFRGHARYVGAARIIHA